MRTATRVLLVCTLAWLLVSLAEPAPASAAPGESWSPASVLLDQGPSPRFAAAGVEGSNPVAAGTIVPRPRTATITVTYHDFPGDAEAAFEHAARILEGLVTSPAEIKVDASWVDVTGTWLALTAFRQAYKDDELDSNLPLANVLYPSALANAYRGYRVDSVPDIRISVDSRGAWYTGIDGAVPPDRYDLVTVALHELITGLGFGTGMDIVSGVAKARSSTGFPSAFDHFVVTGDGQRVAALLASKPGSLAGYLTSGNLRFDGVTAKAAAGGSAPRLFAPSTWETGSSVGHLSPEVYDAPTPNCLMLPGLYRGWAIHDPGAVGLAILKDLGWTISGLVAPARLSVNRLAYATRDGRDLPVQPVVTVQDPVGAPVPSDSATMVTLRMFGTDDVLAAGCSGTAARALVAGAAAYSGCHFHGAGFGYVRATAENLIDGASNLFVVTGEDPTILPVMSRDR